MEENRRVRAARAASITPGEGSGSCDVELAHAGALRRSVLHEEAGDDVLVSGLFSDQPLPARSGLISMVTRPPAVRCGCAVCVLAAVQSPNAARGQLSACESIRRQRDRTLFGSRKRAPGLGYTLEDVARFLGATIGSVRACAKRLRVYRVPEGDRCSVPLTRREAKRVIQAWRSKHHGP